LAVADKDIAKLVKRIEKAGLKVERSGKNYYLVTAPDGSFIVRIPSTPSGTNTVKRVTSKLRKHGYEV
jgi:hypothetical protein